MKHILKLICITILLSIVVTNFSFSDDLADQLTKVGTKNVQNYITPIFSGWGADLNSGFYHSADLHGVLGFDVGLKIGLALTKDDDKKYNFLTPDSVIIQNPVTSGNFTLVAGKDYDREIVGAPTSVGAKDANLYVKMLEPNPADADYVIRKAIYDTLLARKGNDNLFPIPNGFNLPVVPLFIPQAAIGLPFGIEIIGRFIPTISAGDAGKFNYMGFGVRYDIDQHIPLCPVQIAIHLVTQKMNFKSKSDKDIFKASGTAYGVEISKRFVFITLYGGFQFEKASFTLSQIEGKFVTPFGETTFTIPETTYKGKNKSRLTAGLRALLGVVNIHADYSIAKSPVITAGFGISFR